MIGQRAMLICLLMTTELCCGCRLPHNLVKPVQKPPEVNARHEQPSTHRGAAQVAATNPQVITPAPAHDELTYSSAEAAPAQTPTTSLAPASYTAAPPITPSDAQPTPVARTISDSIPIPDSKPSLVAHTSDQPASNSDPTSTAPNVTKPSIELQIDNVRPNRGAIKVAVFTDAASFLNPSAVDQAFDLPDSSTNVRHQLSSDKPFAIAVFQDIDGNGQLTKNRSGIPVEPCAFSNNVVIKRGPPKFSDAVVQPSSTAAPTRVSIRLP